MQNVLSLNDYGVAEMQQHELVETDGGALGFLATVGAGLIVGVTVAAVTVILTDWDNVEKGFASTQTDN